MKKKWLPLLSLVMALTLLAGCTSGQDSSAPADGPNTEAVSTSATSTTTTTTTKTVKTTRVVVVGRSTTNP